MAKKKSETPKTETASGPSPQMLALFAPRADLETRLSTMKRRNMPPLVKPDAIPIGGVMAGKILAVVPSPVTTVKGKLLHLEIDTGPGQTTEITFPLTGVIRNALCPGVKDEGEAIDKAMAKEIGKTLVVRRLPDKPSKFKRSMFMFDVFTSED